MYFMIYVIRPYCAAKCHPRSPHGIASVPLAWSTCLQFLEISSTISIPPGNSRSKYDLWSWYLQPPFFHFYRHTTLRYLHIISKTIWVKQFRNTYWTVRWGAHGPVLLVKRDNPFSIVLYTIMSRVEKPSNAVKTTPIQTSVHFNAGVSCFTLWATYSALWFWSAGPVKLPFQSL